MTLPDERYRAVRFAEEFLRELAIDRKKYPRVPKSIRQEASAILRHYPSQYEMDMLSNAVPDMFSKEKFNSRGE